MTEPTLSPVTQASVQGLVRAKADLAQWTTNLEHALADDVSANPPRLTQDEATEVAKTHGVDAPSAPHHEAEEPAPEEKAERPDDDDDPAPSARHSRQEKAKRTPR
jgi:hypothetical protein